MTASTRLLSSRLRTRRADHRVRPRACGYGIELVSTGGTAQGAGKDAGLAVIDVAELTGFPEMMDGRVKTLHPKVHGGLLAVRDNAGARRRRWHTHGIRPIDLLVVNLYPFEAHGARKARIMPTCIENIDIGGPAMIRAAAKNHADVAVLVDAGRLRRGCWRELWPASAARPRSRCASGSPPRPMPAPRAYDAAISNWFADDARRSGAGLSHLSAAGSSRRCATARTRTSRRPSTARRDARFGVATARQAQGKQLSYNNINDTDAAYECVAEFDPERTAACAIIKHANPCGVAEGDDLARRLPQGARLRSGLGVRRHRRAQPHARCGRRARHHRDLHRGDHRAGCDRGGDRDRRRQEEPAAAARRRPARSARGRPDW